MADGGGGQYDLVSASGDADLRLIYGGDVKPVNVDLIPSLEGLPPVPQEPVVQHDRRRALRRLAPVRSRTCCSTTPRSSRPRRPAGASSTTSQTRARSRVPDNPIQIADAALYLSKTQARASASPTPTSSPRRSSTRPSTLLKQQKPLVKKYWSLAARGDSLFQNGDVWSAPRGRSRPITLKKAGAAGRRHDPEGRRDRLGRHLAARHQGAAPQLRVPVDEVDEHPERRRRSRRSSFGETPANTKACAQMDQLEKGVRASTTPTQPDSYFDTIKFWKTPLAHCGNGKNDCVPSPEVGDRLDADHRLIAGRSDRRGGLAKRAGPPASGAVSGAGRGSGRR